ncbi:MAG: VWA domain-containing protein [Balneolaceae bacterium]
MWLLLLIPVVGTAWWYISNRNRTVSSRYFNERLLHRLRRGYWARGDRLKGVAILLSISLFIIGLAGPRIGTEVRDIEQRGVDLLILLDLSRSMNAEDIRPSRLEKAKFELERLIDRSVGDRIGLLVFTGEAFVQSPMTLDHSALRMFLDIVATDQMPGGGTHFGNAFRKASETFDSLDGQQEDAARVVLMVSDGEDHSPDWQQELQQLTGRGIYVFTVGIGTPQGARIPIYEEGTNRLNGYHRDSRGEEIVSRLESNVLQDIAQRGSGSYYEISNGSAGIDPFLARLDELQQGEFAVREYADYSNRYQILLLGGLLFFVVALLLPEYRQANL